MIIISHRGCWKSLAEKNTLTAFNHSISLNLGTETDIRDSLGRLVISHDMPLGNEMLFDDFLKLWPKNEQLPLALNVKADGLALKLKQTLDLHDYHNYFLFDMSIPDMVQCLKQGLKVFARVSELESKPCCYQQVVGVWLDAFYDDWYSPAQISQFLDDNKMVCLVSSELHGRNPDKLWQMLLDSQLNQHPNLMLCTDKPEEAIALLGSE